MMSQEIRLLLIPSYSYDQERRFCGGSSVGDALTGTDRARKTPGSSVAARQAIRIRRFMIEGKLMNGVIVFLNKLGAAATATVVAIALLLGAGSALAATVVKDGAVAIAIQDLTIGGSTYDVAFPSAEAMTIYPPGSFDFNSPVAAQIAAESIVAALNAKGGVRGVGGCGACGDASEYFFIPYDSFDIDFDPPFFDPFNVTFLRVWEGYKEDSDESVWADGDILDATPQVTEARYAKFTLISSGGSANAPPAADAGGSYSGAAGMAVTFDGSESTDSDGIIVRYEWDFGDGASLGTASLEDVIHTYSLPGIYHVNLTVTDDLDKTSSDTTFANIGMSQPPNAVVGGPYTGSVGKSVQFSGVDSEDPDGIIVRYEWDFGDGLTATLSDVDVIHTYSLPGIYTVTLTTTDNAGDTDKDVTEAIIGLGNIAPVADAGGPYIAEANAAVRFNGSGSFDPDGSSVTYFWDFGDGTMGSGVAPLHTYSANDSYTVNLTVTDEDGITDAAGTAVVITDNFRTRPRTDIIGMPDVNGDGSPDVATVFTNEATGQNLVQVRDGDTGVEIRELNYGQDLTLAIGSFPRAGLAPALAVMSELSSGELQAQVRNAETGMLVNNVSFGSTYSGIDMVILPDSNGNGIAEAAVVGEDENQGVRVIVKDLDSAEKIGAVFHGAGVKALQLAAMPDLNSDGVAEVALLERTRSNNKVRVWVIDPAAQVVLTNIDYGAAVETITLAIVSAADPADTGVAVLGLRADTNEGRILTKNALTGATISNIQWSNSYSPVDLATVVDTNGNGSFDLALMEQNADGNVRIRVYDSETGAQTNSMPLQQLSSGVAVAAMDDVNGNGSSEVATLGGGDVPLDVGLGDATSQLRIHTKDSVDQSTVFIAPTP
jgi:PKD repeat protein